MSDNPEVPKDKIDKKRPRTERPCPKCGGTWAYGPQYRSADARFPVERLRFDCVTCGFISCEPVQTATDDEKKLVAETQQKLLAKWQGGDGFEAPDPRNREIQDVYRAETRRSYGWRG